MGLIDFTNPEDGLAAETSVTDLAGNTVFSVQARREGGEILLNLTGKAQDVSFQVIGDEPLPTIVKH